MSDWYNDSRDDLADFAEWMYEEGYPVTEIFGMIRKPWNWEAEHVLYKTGAVTDA